ncbi:MAG TPA: CsbD family protein [Nocardioidaceae bacterium]|nr:CsbD family protein [Nocardioidaceae bacterium]
MGNDKMKNKGEGALGKGKEKLGSATNDKSLENEGRKDQSKSDAKQAGEKVKDAFKR